MTMKRLLAISVLICSAARAQVDQHGDRNIYGNLVVNGSVTRLSRGTTLPATCNLGDVFFDTDATPGQNLYGCTAFGVWTLQAGGGGGGGISQLNGLTAGTQTFATVNDTNITVAVGSTTATHTITVGFTGTLAKARQHAATVYNDASYANPAWITSLDWSKLTGVPSTFTPAAHNHAGTEITTGLVPSARLAPSPGGTGATCLGDNQTWVACGGGGGGESNTASNLSGGIGLFASKVGVDLRFKSLLAGSSAISIAANGSGNTVDIDLVPGNVVITSLSGWPGGLTTTELGYVANVTSDIQTQLNAKATMARVDGGTQTTSYAFTRTAQIMQWKLTLGGNVTSTTSGLVSGDLLSFEICQDATGNRDFTWPTGFSKASAVVRTASTCSKQLFTWNGTSAEPQAGMISDESGVVVRGSTVSALGTPASGSVCWLDSTAGGWSCKDSSGNVTIMPRVEASATPNQFVTHVPASGVPAKAQPSFANLSGAATDAQIPNLNTLSTGLTPLRCVEADAFGNLTVAADLCNVSGGGGTVTSVDASGGVETTSGSPITTSGTIRASMLVNAQTGTTYTIVTGDRGKLVTLSNASAIAVTLPQAGGTFPAGWYALLNNIGAGTVTVTPTTSTVSGAATITLETGEWALITSDGTNYNAVGNRITAGTNVTLTKSRTGVQVAASGGGGGSTACPTGIPLIIGAPLQYLAANGYPNDNVLNPATASIANTPAGTRVYIPCDFNPQSLSFSVQTAGASTCTFAVGIYNSSNNLVISSGVIKGDGSTTVACNSTGTKTLTSATSPAATGLNTSYSAGIYTITSGTNEATTAMRIRALPVNTGWGGLINGVDSTMMGYWTTSQAWSAGAPASSFTYGSGFNSSVVSVPLTILKLQ